MTGFAKFQTILLEDLQAGPHSRYRWGCATAGSPNHVDTEGEVEKEAKREEDINDENGEEESTRASLSRHFLSYFHL